MEIITVDNSDSPESPPLKRTKITPVANLETEKEDVPKVKFRNADLPNGCLNSNAWCGIFIPTIAHAAGGDNVHPWIVEDDVLIPILTEAWNVVYADKPLLMEYNIVPGSAVYHVVRYFIIFASV